MGTETPRNSLDDALLVLRDSDRRRMVGQIARNGPSHLAHICRECASSETPAGEVAIEVYHQHLPLLLEMEYVSWVEYDSVIGPGPRFDEVEQLYALIHENEDDLDWNW